MGFMPALKYLQKNSLIVFERGRKAHDYVLLVTHLLIGSGSLSPDSENMDIVPADAVQYPSVSIARSRIAQKRGTIER